MFSAGLRYATLTYDKGKSHRIGFPAAPALVSPGDDLAGPIVGTRIAILGAADDPAGVGTHDAILRSTAGRTILHLPYPSSITKGLYLPISNFPWAITEPNEIIEFYSTTVTFGAIRLWYMEF